MKYKKTLIVVTTVIFLGILIFLYIGWTFYQEPRQAQKKEAQRINKIAENNPNAAEKLKLWKEGKIELSQEEIEELVKIFDSNEPN